MADFPVEPSRSTSSGALLLGFLLRYAIGTTSPSPELRAGLTIGFCGAFTTMSTFSYESLTLLEGGEYSRAGLGPA